MVSSWSQLGAQLLSRPWKSGIRGVDKSSKGFDWEVEYNRLILRCLGLWPIDDRFKHLKFFCFLTLLIIYSVPPFVRTLNVGSAGIIKSMIEAIPIVYVTVQIAIFKYKSDKVETIILGIHENWKGSVDVSTENRKPMIVYGGRNRLIAAASIGLIALVWAGKITFNVPLDP